MMAWKIAPALAAGNVVVHKPAQNTSLTALKAMKQRMIIDKSRINFIELQIAELLRDKCGLPNGVLSIVTGDGETLGNAMTLHPDINKVSTCSLFKVIKYACFSSSWRIILSNFDAHQCIRSIINSSPL